jgi:hypothetical protein
MFFSGIVGSTFLNEVVDFLMAVHDGQVSCYKQINTFEVLHTANPFLKAFYMCIALF